MRQDGPVIGVLGIQGDVEENVSQTRIAFSHIGKKGDIKIVRHSEDISGISGLILPGGESTVISNLVTVNRELFGKIADVVSKGMPVLGTCAGMIILSTRTHDRVIGQTNHKLLSLLNIVVERNAFGRQNESFEADIQMAMAGEDSFKGIFIRAPAVTEAGKDVEVLAKFNNRIVAVRQKNVIGTAFHPELSGDSRIHRHLVKMAVDFRR